MRRPLIVATALIIVMLAAPSLAAVPSFNITRFYAEAEFAAAIRPYTEAIARNANDAEAHYWLGVAYLHGARLHRLGLAPYATGFAAKAVESLERATKLRADVRALVALMEAYAVINDQAKSADVTARLVRIGEIPLKK